MTRRPNHVGVSFSHFDTLFEIEKGFKFGGNHPVLKLNG